MLRTKVLPQSLQLQSKTPALSTNEHYIVNESGYDLLHKSQLSVMISLFTAWAHAKSWLPLSIEMVEISMRSVTGFKNVGARLAKGLIQLEAADYLTFVGYGKDDVVVVPTQQFITFFEDCLKKGHIGTAPN